MCILSYLPPNVDVDEEGLWNGGLHNPDGHGWAITAGDHIVIGKSMELVGALDDFLTARKANPAGHALFHSRWATHGNLDTSNVHPFHVGGSEKTVVAHNGILPSSAWPAKGDSRSDTRLFADEILSTRYRRLNRPRVQEALTNWIGTGNKLVILTVDPRYRRNAYLINERIGHWDKDTGIWHSNWDYAYAPTWLYPASKGKGKTTTTRLAIASLRDETGPNSEAWQQQARRGMEWLDPCWLCEGMVNQRTNYCYECNACQDCMEDKVDCFCYTREQRDDDDDVWQTGDDTYRWTDDDVPTDREGTPTIGWGDYD